MIGNLADFRSYATQRGNAAPTDADDAEATAALVRASDHITFAYIARFASGFDVASPNVEAAAYEIAALELATPGFFSKTFTQGERKVLTEVKGIKWQVVGDTANASASPISTRVEDMLRPYLYQPVGVFVV